MNGGFIIPGIHGTVGCKALNISRLSMPGTRHRMVQVGTDDLMPMRGSLLLGASREGEGGRLVHWKKQIDPQGLISGISQGRRQCA